MLKKLVNRFIVPVLWLCSTPCYAESEYLFHQQLNDGCRVLPMLNHEKLERLGNNISQTPWYEWQTRREYLGEDFSPYYIWMTAFDTLNQPSTPYPHLRKYFEKAIIQGPVLPYFYKKNGEFDGENLASFPNFFIDYGSTLYNNTLLKALQEHLMSEMSISEIQQEIREVLPEIILRIPLLREKDNTTKIYNSVTQQYDKVILKNTPTPPTTCAYKYPVDLQTQLIMPANSDLFVNRFKKYQNLHYLGSLVMAQTARYDEKKGICVPYYPLGCKEICEFVKLPLEIHIATHLAHVSGRDTKGKQSGKAYMTMGAQGRTKMLFLRLGIDEQNNMIQSNHRLSKVYSDFKKLCNSIKNHPWRDALCSRKTFFQYHCAQIFIKNKELYEAAQQVLLQLKSMSTFPSSIADLERYHHFIAEVKKGNLYRDNKGTAYQFTEVQPFILGPEQMLAFSFAHIMRLAWYGAINESAFQEILPSLRFKELKNALTKKHVIQGKQWSFIDVCSKIIATITQKTNNKNFISFEYHGWVISFDLKLINEQAKTAQDANLLRQLGFVGIETIHSSKLSNAFYRRTRKAQPKLRNERSRILMVEELAKQLQKILTNDPQKMNAIQNMQPTIKTLKETNNKDNNLSSQQLAELTKIEQQLKPLKVDVDQISQKLKETFRGIIKQKNQVKTAINQLASALNSIQ